MGNLINRINLEHFTSFFDALFGHQYPISIWRLPHSNTISGIADLRPAATTKEEIELEEIESGFIVNSFDHHHPTQPFLIKGDLLLEWNDQGVNVEQNPILSDKEISAFEHIYNSPLDQVKYYPPSKQLDYKGIVEQAVKEIVNKSFTKVVLSRFDDQKLPENFSISKTFEKACKAYPNAFVYALYTPKHGYWLGATPETLLSIDSQKYFKTISLASTQKLEDSQALNEVAWTQKEIEEQAMVCRYIINCFKKIRLREFTENGPKTIKAGSMAHLKTEYDVDMESVNMPKLGTIMMDLLHPTSAVCGMPLEFALAFIKSHENYERELYAGFLGPVNIKNSTNLFVNLRCMKIMNRIGRFYAGAGITEDSNPEKEFIETQLKMETLKKIIL